MESQIKLTTESYQIKAKIKEFIEETNEIFESKARQMNLIIQSITNEHIRLLSRSKLFFFNLLVFVLCDKSDIPMEIIHNNNSNQSKKKEKSDINTYNHKNKNNIKSNEIMRVKTKNSYYSKYLEEFNKKIKKNNILRQSKGKIEQKKRGNSIHQNLSLLSNKKPKINSMDKNLDYNQINYNQKKYAIHLNNEFSQNKTIEYNNNNKKPNNMISMASKYKKPSNISNNRLNKNENVQIPEIKDLSQKEKSYLILSYSKCLRLCERVIFARSTSKLRQSISIKNILDTNQIYLNDKKKELENKIEYCNDKLKTKFMASKTAEITLNFITINIENEFKLNLFDNLNNENDKKYCYSYVKILYLLLDENYSHIENENLIKQLYQKISNKGYTTIKDYLYNIYIKNLKENKIIENIDKINDILINVPDLLNFKKSILYDRFISYTCYLFKEIVNYSNGILDAIKLKRDCKNYIDIINNKINLYNERCLLKSNYNK